MLIGILTFLSVENCGALLQAYALSTTLKNMGNDVELINITSNNEKSRKGLKILKNKAFLARKVFSFFYIKSLRERNNLFNEFRNNYLSIYPREKKVLENELENFCKKYDYLVCGSDQIWSQDPKLYDKSDAYFVNFPFNGKRISYAASFGDNLEYAEKNKKRILSYIKKFDNVSVREIDAKKFLDKNKISCEVSIDPTLLVEKNDWEKLAIIPQENEDYILYFSVNSRKYSINIAKKLAKETGLKVIELNPHPKSWNSGFIKKFGIGPREFLGYILNAKYVVTNSFHGTVFSILFNKDFYAAFDEKDGIMIKENRKYTLLERVGLIDCIMTESKEIDLSKIKNINWKDVNKEISILKKDSINYLEKSIK